MPEEYDSNRSSAGPGEESGTGDRTSAHEPPTTPGVDPEATVRTGGADTASPDDEATSRTAHPWESGGESTQVIGVVAAATPHPEPTSAEQTQPVPMASGGAGSPPSGSPPFGDGTAQHPSAGGGRPRRGKWVRGGIIAACVLGALAVLYVGDLLFTSGEVPRGSTVAGVQIGGMKPAAAEHTLRTRLGPNLNRPVDLVAGPARARLDPGQAGLSVDWQATVRRAGQQSWNPFTRVTSLFTSHDHRIVTHGNRAQLVGALNQVRPKLDQKPVEGTIRFDGARPIPVDPKPGRAVDMRQAPDAVLDQWTRGTAVRLPVSTRPVSTNPAGVRRALNEFAKPATSAPLTVTGDGATATVSPEAIAGALRFTPDGSGGLKSDVDADAITAAAKPQLASTEHPGRDATFTFDGGHPSVVPSEDGRGIDWKRTLAPLRDTLMQQPPHRTLTAAYVPQKPKLTTEQANAMGVVEPIGEFTTTGFKPDSGVNIRRVAQQVNGAVIRPGDVFSLNGHTGPRGAEQGYVPAGVIKNGKPAKDIGGGISQFATTLYNASYFAGMRDVEHKEHSYYISRYPMGREATVYQGHDGSSLIDVKFGNSTGHGVVLQTEWTPHSITVRLWGTKRFDVQSQTGRKSAPTPPPEVHQPAGPDCHTSTGKPGFTVTNTRVLHDVNTGQVKREPHHVKYNPHPKIVCDPPA